MLTLNEIANVSFRKSNFAGYKPEDVDEFIDKIVESYDLLIKKNIEQKEINEALAAENERLKNSVQGMTSEKKVRPEEIKLSEECEYTQEEIKNALLSAQKLANASIREGRQKAETMIQEANAKAERIVSVAQSEVNAQKEELDRLKKLVSDFRASLLDAYKEHLKLVNSLPTLKGGVTVVTEKREPLTTEKQPVKEETPVKKQEMTQKEEPVKEKPVKQEKKPVEERKVEEQEEKKEDLSETKSFQLGRRKNGIGDTGEFSELKFGADYDITKD